MASHQDRLRTPPVNDKYRENYKKIDWTKKKKDTSEPRR